MKTHQSLLLVGCLCATTAAHAQGTLVISPSSMGAVIPGTWPHTTDSQDFTFPTPAVSLGNYSAVQVKFSAPSGYAWRITPSSLAGRAFDCSVYYTASPEADYFLSADYSFNFVAGMDSEVSGGVTGARVNETSFGFDSDFQFAGNVQFTDLTITLHYDPGHDWQVAQRPLGSFDTSSMKLTYYGVPDPNQDLLLVPIPEPSVATLAGLGAGLATVRFAGRKLT